MLPCDGLKVLSFNHFLAGPAAAQHLGDLGADVIAVEPIAGAFQRNWAVANHFVGKTSVNHFATGRNKRSLAVDMKSDDGKAIVHRLIAAADVVMENFRPGTMERLGFGADTLLTEHPRLVYAAATGYGADGPYAARPGQDLLLQAMAGLAGHTGRADGPPIPVGSVIIDHHAAALCVMGILAALLRRERTGQGGRVDVSLLQAAVDLQGESITAWLNGAPREGPRGPAGVASWFSAGGYGVFATTDGHIAAAMAPPATFAKALSIEWLAALSEAEGFSRRAEVNKAVATAISAMTTADAAAALTEGSVWNAPVETYDDLMNNAQLKHLGTFRQETGPCGEAMTLVGGPVHFDGEAHPVRRLPQPLGAQSREILAEVGYAPQEIDAFVEAGTVGASPGSG